MEKLKRDADEVARDPTKTIFIPKDGSQPFTVRSNDEAAMQACWRIILKRVTDNRTGTLRERIHRQVEYKERLRQIGEKEILIEEAAMLLSLRDSLAMHGNPDPSLAEEVSRAQLELGDLIEKLGRTGRW